MTSNGRQPPMEVDLKILNVEYLGNRWLDQNLSLSSVDQTQIKNAWNEDDHQWKTGSKYPNLNISATTDCIFLKFYTKAQGTKQN
jgi:hypothetical protein